LYYSQLRVICQKVDKDLIAMATEKEKTGIATEKGEEIHSVQNGDAEAIYGKFDENEFEVFKRGEDVVDFRNVEWYKASVIFLKGKKLLITWGFDIAKVKKSSSQPVS